MKLIARLRLSLLSKLVLLITSFSIVPMFATVWLFMWLQPQYVWKGIGALIGITAFTLTGAFFFARHLTRPIRAMMRGVERIALGDFRPSWK